MSFWKTGIASMLFDDKYIDQKVKEQKKPEQKTPKNVIVEQEPIKSEEQSELIVKSEDISTALDQFEVNKEIENLKQEIINKYPFMKGYFAMRQTLQDKVKEGLHETVLAAIEASSNKTIRSDITHVLVFMNEQIHKSERSCQTAISNLTAQSNTQVAHYKDSVVQFDNELVQIQKRIQTINDEKVKLQTLIDGADDELLKKIKLHETEQRMKQGAIAGIMEFFN